MKRKVIGWADNSDFELVEGEIDPSYFEALYENIDDNEYFFSGDLITLCPVFDDYHILDFSSRGWAHIMANDNFDDDYLEYYVGDANEDYKFPKEGPYSNDVPVMKLPDEIYQLVKENTIEFFYKPSEYDNAYVLLPLESDDQNVYWPRLLVTFKNELNGETFDAEVRKIIHIYDESTLEEIIQHYKFISPIYTDKPEHNLVIYPKNLTEKLKNNPLVVLLLCS